MLIAPFVGLVVLAVAPASYLSFRNGQQAVNDVAHQLRGELTTRVEEHLVTFLATPHQINQVNANALRQGWLKANDANALERHFWEQVQIFDAVTSIYFGNTAGGLVNAGREGPTGSLYVIVTDGFASGPFRKYATDSQGKRTELLATVPDFDARTRPWYTGAIAKGDATWSEVYILFTGQDMAIAASRPVYDEQEALLGVVSVDLFLSHLSNFLQSLKIGKTGQAFIMEHSGLLVASSTPEKPFTEAEGDKAQRRLYASESTNPLIREAAEALAERFGNYDHLTGTQQLEFKIEGQRHFLQVTPVKNEYGLDWLIVLIIPEADFMAQINANNRTTVFLVVAALAVAVSAGIIAARRITRPIIQLKASAQALAQGRWGQPLGDDSRISEISALTWSFNEMAGQLQQMLESLTTEIAERKRVEEALRVSEERYRLLAENAADVIWTMDLNLRSTYTSPSVIRLRGYSADEARAQTLEEALTPASFETAMQTFKKEMAIENMPEQDLSRTRTLELEVTRKDGSTVWTEATMTFLRGLDGRPVGILGVSRDITERKRLAEQLIQQERLAAVGQLAAGIAHDFNNILTSMLGYAELLRTSPDMPEAARAYLEKIIIPGQRAAHLVRQILDFSRKSMRQPKRLDLVPFIKEIVKFLERTIPETIQLSLDIEPGDYLVEADPTQIHQLLTNLVLNARDAMPAGGKLRVILSRVEAQGEVSCAACNQAVEGDWISVTVTDTGNGILPEVLPRIFEPFFTTKEVGQGSGLGLSQVLGIVQQHAGHIAVNSQVSQGTTFTCYLPPLTLRQPKAELNDATPMQPGKGETILLVEDEPMVLEVSKSMLQHLGYQVLTATNGREALVVYADHQDTIALVLSDMVMPDMEGVALFNVLKAQNPEIKVVLMSGYPLGEKGVELLEQGIIDWFQKPISLGELSQIISQALGR